jgi:hypothetical protein
LPGPQHPPLHQQRCHRRRALSRWHHCRRVLSRWHHPRRRFHCRRPTARLTGPNPRSMSRNWPLASWLEPRSQELLQWIDPTARPSYHGASVLAIQPVAHLRAAPPSPAAYRPKAPRVAKRRRVSSKWTTRASGSDPPRRLPREGYPFLACNVYVAAKRSTGRCGSGNTPTVWIGNLARRSARTKTCTRAGRIRSRRTWSKTVPDCALTRRAPIQSRAPRLRAFHAVPSDRG